MLAGINLIINELLRTAQMWRTITFHGPETSLTRHLRIATESVETWGDHWVWQPYFTMGNLKVSEEKGLVQGEPGLESHSGLSIFRVPPQMWTAQRKKRKQAHPRPHNFTLASIQQTFLKHLPCSGNCIFPLAPPPNNTRAWLSEVPPTPGLPGFWVTGGTPSRDICHLQGHVFGTVEVSGWGTRGGRLPLKGWGRRRVPANRGPAGRVLEIWWDFLHVLDWSGDRSAVTTVTWAPMQHTSQFSLIH